MNAAIQPDLSNVTVNDIPVVPLAAFLWACGFRLKIINGQIAGIEPRPRDPRRALSGSEDVRERVRANDFDIADRVKRRFIECDDAGDLLWWWARHPDDLLELGRQAAAKLEQCCSEVAEDMRKEREQTDPDETQLDIAADNRDRAEAIRRLAP